MAFEFTPEGQVEIPEITYKETVRLPVDQTALVIIDMQNDFVKPEGALVVDAARETIPNIQHLLAMARDHGMQVAYTQDTHIEGSEEWEIWPEHVAKGTWGWEIIEELQPQPGEPVFEKPRYDGFYASGLDHYLSRVWDVKHVIIVGTVANICVAHTAASAGLRWFHIVVPANGISAMNAFDQALTLRQASWLYNGSVVRDVKDIQIEA
jgi:nicotinamidase-related amidase